MFPPIASSSNSSSSSTGVDRDGVGLSAVSKVLESRRTACRLWKGLRAIGSGIDGAGWEMLHWPTIFVPFSKLAAMVIVSKVSLKLKRHAICVDYWNYLYAFLLVSTPHSQAHINASHGFEEEDCARQVRE